MLYSKILKSAACSIFTFLLFLNPLFAQLQSNFYPDKLGACVPFSVTFTNTSTGASSQAVYEWDFGNGNHSSLLNASAVFQEEKVFTVTLTVTDGGKTSKQIKTITGYKKPTVNFSSTLTSGCTPLPVSFNSTSTPGDGNIASYYWDFGDGATQQAYAPQSTHTYITAQKPPVTLVVSNNYGCTSSKTIENLFEVLPGVTADFSADDSFICFATDPVQLKDKSTGFTNALKYNWDFGDGTISTVKDPIHVFNTKGTYTVKLAVENSVGCKSTLTKTSFINVGNFQSDFTTPTATCNNASVVFQNTSVPKPTSYTWTIDGSFPITGYGNSYSHYFSTPGKHTIKLTNSYGSCIETVAKEIEVWALPQAAPFIADVPPHCFGPVTVSFSDTTSGIVKSEWNFERLYWPLRKDATGKDVKYTFTQANSWMVTLFVTDANGCTNSREQAVQIRYPYVQINTTDANGLRGCGSLTKKFEFATTETLTSILWDFGNGNTSTDPTPQFTFLQSSTVSLTYTTSKGCKGVSYYYEINVFQKPKAEFVSKSGTTICGNSIVIFETPQVNYWDYWLIDGVYAGTSYYTKFQYQFADTGMHTVSLIVYNDGCRDTMTKVNYIRVLPSFPKIYAAKNTCVGDRGTITFTQTSRLAEKWIWDFGDGSPLVTLNTNESTITHDYKATGRYSVVLATVAGSCTVKDSMYVYVQMKRSPVLSSSVTTVCKDAGIAYVVTNVEKLSYEGIWVWAYLDSYEYNDGTTIKNDIYGNWDNRIYSNPYLNTFKPLQNDKTSFRVITRQPYFDCLDTSNFIPIKVAGANAGFEITRNDVCFRDPVIFNDTSKAYNNNITSRQWSFGDGQTLTTTQGGTVSHTYANPGYYNVTLTITDDGGCSSTSLYSSQGAIVNGPKAAFYASGTNVQLNTAVQFYNNSNTYNSYPTLFSWQFGDGGTSVDYNPTHTFTVAGTYQVRLIAKNTATGCTDTTFQQIVVKDFQVAFSFQQSFIMNGKCPPLLYQFYNRSTNYTSLKWDFGDGNVANNLTNPSHLYTAAGTYTISLFVTGYNGLTDIFKETITITKATVSIAADLFRGCAPQSVTLNANKNDGYTYAWDFGNGFVKTGTDSFAVHQYKDAGVFLPSLIVLDKAGCASSVKLTDTVVIESLKVAMGNVPQNICAPRLIDFTPQIVSIGGNQTLTYHWDFGTGNKADTSNVKNPAFTFQNAGKFKVSLTVKSSFGCEKSGQTDIQILQGLGAQIAGPVRICQGAIAQFTGSTLLPGQPSWKWIFHDGTVISQQIPPAKKYDVPGTFSVRLIVDNGGCVDTVNKTIQVDAKPVVNLPFIQYTLCMGSNVNITATGGSTYAWSPATGLNNTNTANIIAAPVVNTTYKVNVTSAYGCSSSDSVRITVVQPIDVQVANASPICSGTSTTLNASGAFSYQWIQNTTGLNSTAIANPVAKPVVSTIYTVVGTDANKCFKDTAIVQVNVLPVPTVDAGPTVTVMTGMPHQLQPVFSNDVVRWLWTPATYLSCTNCASPVSSPLAPVIYTLTVANAAGCSVADTVSINLVCSESRIFFPTAFTPNNDGSNDKFGIKGDGIRIIHHFVIFDRYGRPIFERNNFTLQDAAASWDGTYKGAQVSPGSYVYFAEMSCNDKTFTRKGSVILIR